MRPRSLARQTLVTRRPRPLESERWPVLLLVDGRFGLADVEAVAEQVAAGPPAAPADPPVPVPEPGPMALPVVTATMTATPPADPPRATH